MIPIQRLAFIGNHLPRHCGIATFTHDLHHAVATARPDWETGVVVMTDTGRQHDYPSCVRYEVREDQIEDYARAAAFLAAIDTDLISLQHEYGIFGGEAGGHILDLLARVTTPVVTTLHTVLSDPTPAQRQVMDQVIDRSTKLVVMAERGRDILRRVHGVPDGKIAVIPHGIPDVPFLDPDDGKEALGFAGKMVILTFGLLSPNKGIETMLDAMPGILQACPDAIYVVLGASHPNLIRDHGEAYRDSLAARASALGIEQHVVFINQFVDQPRLLQFIAACDVYVTPYPAEAQMTSGTLSYSFGLGSAIVSTPYWHAAELLADGLGVLTPFNDAATLSQEIGALLTDDARRNRMRERAYTASRTMTWAATAARYAAVFEEARALSRVQEPKPPRRLNAPSDSGALPPLRLEHFLSFCDSTGMLQHARYGTVDRLHGYCLDDNARALLFASALERLGGPWLPDGLPARLAAFIQHAWNPDIARFRNFMSFDRQWLESTGSEDSHARALWALGDHVLTGIAHKRLSWAEALFLAALPPVESFGSPRAWGFTLLGLDAWCQVSPGDLHARHIRRVLAERLMTRLGDAEYQGWVWFEDVLSYDNARLPQALIQTGLAMNEPRYVKAGLRALEWLMVCQTSPSGYFRPVGTDSFGNIRERPRPFDQQPVEAAATISACLAAWSATGDMAWRARAITAFRWFLGHNDLATPLADQRSGGCGDGLHPGGRNENMGAESTLSYLLGLAELHALKKMSAIPEQAARFVSHA